MNITVFLVPLMLSLSFNLQSKPAFFDLQALIVNSDHVCAATVSQKKYKTYHLTEFDCFVGSAGRTEMLSGGSNPYFPKLVVGRRYIFFMQKCKKNFRVVGSIGGALMLFNGGLVQTNGVRSEPAQQMLFELKEKIAKLVSQRDKGMLPVRMVHVCQ
jgi:hypothetical protein